MMTLLKSAPGTPGNSLFPGMFSVKSTEIVLKKTLFCEVAISPVITTIAGCFPEVID
jgi:hypothetical protein